MQKQQRDVRSMNVCIQKDERPSYVKDTEYGFRILFSRFW